MQKKKKNWETQMQIDQSSMNSQFIKGEKGLQLLVSILAFHVCKVTKRAASFLLL